MKSVREPVRTIPIDRMERKVTHLCSRIPPEMVEVWRLLVERLEAGVYRSASVLGSTKGKISMKDLGL